MTIKKEVPKKTIKKRTNYLNNKDLLAETCISLETDKMTSKLSLMLMKLVQRYGSKGNFSGYTYNDDMQAYALMMLVRTWKAFDPEKSSNAFAFFTQCVKNSFIQFLNQERRQRDIRDAMLVDNGLEPSYTYTTSQEKLEEQPLVDDEEDFNVIIQQRKQLEKTFENKSDDLIEF